MNQRYTYNYSSGGSLLTVLISALVSILVLFFFFYVAIQVYKFLYFLTPIFILLAFILYPKIILEHLKSIALSFKNSVIGGIFKVLLQLITLPFVSLGLVFQAWAYRKFGRIGDSRNNYSTEEEPFTYYEEVDPQPRERAKIKSEKWQSQDDMFV